MGTLIITCQLILSLSILVTLHECGHFFPAKWFKTKVDKFYLFFDPGFSLFKYKKGDTEYGIGWLPLGGYVKIAGMIDESMDKEQMEGPVQPWEFRAKPAWQRLIIMSGGVTVNFILGFFILAMLAWSYGTKFVSPEKITEGIYVDSIAHEMGLRDGDHILKIGEKDFDQFDSKYLMTGIVLDGAKNISVRRAGQQINVPIDPSFVNLLSKQGRPMLFGPRILPKVGKFDKGTIAEKNGIRIGDQFLAINETETKHYHNFVEALGENKGAEANFKILRGTDTLTLAINVPKGKPLGVYPEEIEENVINYGFVESFPVGYNNGVEFIKSQINAFSNMGFKKGKIDPRDSLGSVISIGKMFGTEWEWHRFWYLTAVLSLILAIMNLLPIPALDGGHIVFLLWEWVTGVKPSDKFMEYATMFGFVLLMSLMAFVLGLDIWRHIIN